MPYFSTFRDTLFVDVLEWFNIIQIGKEHLNGYKTLKLISFDSTNASEVGIVHKDNVSKYIDCEEDLEKSQLEVTSIVRSMEDVEVFDPFLVSFDGPDDPLIPYNWSYTKRGLVIIQVMLLTCVNYMGSSIYTPGQEEIQHEFHVGHVVGTLNLSVYVLGYGIGPIFFSPLSEISSIGRLPTYMVTFFLFTMLQIGCALVKNIAGLVILRFITGILCSLALATGGASIGDVIPHKSLPLFLGLWSAAAVAAPIIAPLLGAAMVDAKNWRWIFWFQFFLCCATYLVCTFFFPETSSENILYRKAMRLRKITGDDRYYTKKQREEEAINTKDFIITTLYRPFKMIALEPIILAFDLYIALCYGAFYLFFEAFPIVFAGIYHFTLVEIGLAYMGFCVGCVFAYSILIVFLSTVLKKKFETNTFTPEAFLLLAMAVGWCLPLALFLFGWAAKVHWILPMIAEVFFVIAVFNLFQATFSYLAMAYPKYVASVFAGNSFARGSFAAAFPLFGKAMYNNLGSEKYPVGWGSSLIGFLTIGLWLIPFALYKYGPYLRSKSRFTD